MALFGSANVKSGNMSLILVGFSLFLMGSAMASYYFNESNIKQSELSTESSKEVKKRDIDWTFKFGLVGFHIMVYGLGIFIVMLIRKYSAGLKYLLFFVGIFLIVVLVGTTLALSYFFPGAKESNTGTLVFMSLSMTAVIMGSLFFVTWTLNRETDVFEEPDFQN